ncbi:glycerol-3-phosphate dehydrogenase/oxidase [Amaricoccus solimangrovi]|uniref:Glycerol-3-phosphate dehydrogenase/oxidase n=1 Tax=Amaricoccus solimangrovi TaxID=2589815 RepID=A0A501WAJ5_9RHOB|nr:glycerol-3-phosphate dehydrogenase/oxidase [Amaricoccus solimangrovi]TPE46963.1 glycerol-3-phosphate dehydrogenase/oxidase [Amaricoccus solimangrovi]
MRPREDLLGKVRAGAAEGAVLIVGGGINGVGVFRDLARQGVPSLLVERGDFASGTSAAPSRLIHGGLRYLETGEFALVRESVEERNLLLLNAPHQVRPLPVWIPTFSWTGGALAAGLRFLRLRRSPGPKGAAVVRLGLGVFDRFGEFRRTMPRHRAIPIAEARARFPRLAPKVRAVLEYYDARISSPERLTLELVGDAERDCPEAMAIPYLAVEGGEGAGVRLRDTISGETLTVRPRLVVNCAGAWVDPVGETLGVPERLTGGTKGSHLVLDRPDLAAALGEAMLYFETHDHRACLVYRLDGGKVMLGTTDLRTEEPDGARCSEEEIDYLFAVLEEVLPGSAPRREEIVFAVAGVRPLPRSAGGATGAISRDHSLRRFDPAPGRPFPILTLVGGKWTTYRACAAQIADAVLAEIGASRREDTRALPIGGGADFPRETGAFDRLARDIAAQSGLSPARAALLLRRYGTTARAVAAASGGRFTPLEGAAGYSVEEIRWILAEERAARLDDLVLRRTLIGFDGLASAVSVRALARIMAESLGWSAERREAEVARTLTLLARRHHVSVDEPDAEDHARYALG